MNKHIILTAMSLLCSITTLWSQVTLPRDPSPSASISQTIGISSVQVNYSRPAVNEREVWGKLVPYGWNVQPFGLQNKAPWRAGANENTTIEFSHDAIVEGKKVPAGKYGLFFVINEDSSGEVILSKDHQSWGSYFYDPKNDQLKVPITIRDVSHTERLTYDFQNLTSDQMELILNWEKKQFPVSIAFDVNNIVLANAREELKGAKGFNWQGPTSIAQYALNQNIHLDEALAWSDRAIKGNKSFTTLILKSNILEKMNQKEEAEKVKKEAFSVAKEAEINTYGYQLIGQGKNDEAISIFILNTEKFPASANVWDSLGEAHALSGNKKKAIKHFKKSLSLDPPPNVRANSEKYLKDFDAL